MARHCKANGAGFGAGYRRSAVIPSSVRKHKSAVAARAGVRQARARSLASTIKDSYLKRRSVRGKTPELYHAHVQKFSECSASRRRLLVSEAKTDVAMELISNEIYLKGAGILRPRYTLRGLGLRQECRCEDSALPSSPPGPEGLEHGVCPGKWRSAALGCLHFVRLCACQSWLARPWACRPACCTGLVVAV